MTLTEGARATGPLRARPGRGWALPTLALAALMGVFLGRFVLSSGSDAPAPVTAAGDSSSETALARLQEQLRTSPDDPDLLTRLGVSYITRARETADPSYFTKAGQALDRSAALAPPSRLTLTGQGLLALSRHDFTAALAFGTQAHTLDPASAEPLGVIVDAHIELGQYDEATDAAQKMLDRRPSLASLSRASYLRELNGDVPGAITAMTQAAIAGASSANDVAYVETLVGDLHLGAGAPDDADAAYQRALRRVDNYPPALVGLARVAAAREDLRGAAVQLEAVTARLPLPTSLALLGDVYEALDRSADAATQYDLVRRIEELNRANGVVVDLELARFEADHARDPGADQQAAVDLARAALERRPTIFGEDTLAWALRQAGRPAEALPHARAAVRLGTADAVLWYHLAAIEADLGQSDAARADLSKALSLNPHLTVRDLPDARALTGRLGLP